MTTNPQTPDVGRAISWAFDTFRRSPGPFLSLAAVVGGLQLVGNLAARPLTDAFNECAQAQTDAQQLACQSAIGTATAVAVPVFVVLMIASFLAEVGVYRAALAASSGQQPAFAMIGRTDRLGTYVLTVLLRGLLILLGLIACIVPGIVLAFLMQLAPYYALDRGLRPMASIKASITAIRSHVGPALLMVLFTLVVSLVGGGFYGILTILTLPFVSLFVVHMYRQFNSDPIA